jgi:hypothetical protein
MRSGSTSSGNKLWRGSSRAERVLQVADQVGDGLEANGEPQQIGWTWG